MFLSGFRDVCLRSCTLADALWYPARPTQLKHSHQTHFSGSVPRWIIVPITRFEGFLRCSASRNSKVEILRIGTQDYYWSSQRFDKFLSVKIWRHTNMNRGAYYDWYTTSVTCSPSPKFGSSGSCYGLLLKLLRPLRPQSIYTRTFHQISCYCLRALRYGFDTMSFASRMSKVSRKLQHIALEQITSRSSRIKSQNLHHAFWFQFGTNIGCPIPHLKNRRKKKITQTFFVHHALHVNLSRSLQKYVKLY